MLQTMTSIHTVNKLLCGH
uniref:Uncharacterized protein n=1 Tax=Anguilla anguilla TaxID=7936 RepID=A0A0E9V4P1_ANGAN